MGPMTSPTSVMGCGNPWNFGEISIAVELKTKKLKDNFGSNFENHHVIAG